LRISRFARPSAVSLHKHPDVNVHFRIGNGLRRKELESGLRKCGSVEVVRFLDRRVVHAPDGVLEALDPAPDGCDG